MSVHLLHLAGTGGQPLAMNMVMANRHGLIAGATGTGKTVSLQVLAEGFSAAGVPVFMADVKGDLSGLVQPSEISEKFVERLARVGWKDYKPRSFPVLFWDLFGKTGHPIRTTMSEIGPLLLSSLLQLNETQTGVLYAAFRIADDNSFLLLDLKDLQTILDREIMARFDHRDLNSDTPFFEKKPPTPENVAGAIHGLLLDSLPPGLLDRTRLRQDDRLWVDVSEPHA